MRHYTLQFVAMKGICIMSCFHEVVVRLYLLTVLKSADSDAIWVVKFNGSNFRGLRS